MKNLDEKLVNIYELLSDYLEEVGYLEEKKDKEEVKEELTENDENDDDMVDKEDKDETYTEEEVQEILNRE